MWAELALPPGRDPIHPFHLPHGVGEWRRQDLKALISKLGWPLHLSILPSLQSPPSGTNILTLSPTCFFASESWSREQWCSASGPHTNDP